MKLYVFYHFLFVKVSIAQNAWTALIIHSHRSGKFECERALNSPELEEKGPKLVT